VGSGTAGVVLCCADARGNMAAVKKIMSDSDRALQRSLREVAPLSQHTATLACSASYPPRSAALLTIGQVLLMCQLRHPNIVSADDVYFWTDVAPSAAASHPPASPRAQDVYVRMPYYPADLAWLIHSSTQALTSKHIQVHPRVGNARSFRVQHSLAHQLARDAVHFGASAVRPAVIAALAKVPLALASALDAHRRYLHACGVIHRDLKPSNMCASASAILPALVQTHCLRVLQLLVYALSCNGPLCRLVGEHCDVRICDFSLARREAQGALLTKYIVTRWYRPPEILLCKRQYDAAVDVWSAGCMFAELIMPPSPQRRGLFPGATYKDQTDKIIEVRAAANS
jgi:serine/threonine protein kinase